MSKTAFRTHTCQELTIKQQGETVTLVGWVHHRRDHGGILFIDLRDYYGITQITVNPEEQGAFKTADSARREDVIHITGEVVLRPKKMVNTNLDTGAIEVEVKTCSILNKTKTPPFEIDHDKPIDEDLRLEYRYLDLRRERMKHNLTLRHEIMKFTRDFFSERKFLEVQTPILTSSSPEGARDYIVPSRLHAGKFYALPQAPQQYKQLLMVSGIDQYYQIAPCFRDEDPRSDRLPGEFYQLDLEMSFVNQEDVLQISENYLTEITEKIAKKTVLKKPFPRLTYSEAMTMYGSDKPDIRVEMKIVSLTDELKDTQCDIFQKALKKPNGVIHMLRIYEGNKYFSRKDIDELTEIAKTHGAGGLAYVQCQKDGTFSSPIWKFLTEEEQKKVLQKAQEEAPKRILQGSEDILFFGADTFKTASEALGAVRTESILRINKRINEDEKILDPNIIGWVWITDFPMYQLNEEEQTIEFFHNPFSMPQGGLKALNTQDPKKILAFQYDIAANGMELGSGAIRNHKHDIMEKAFEIAGYSKEDLQQQFGHMLKAFSYGAPPHGGFASGIDRLIMLLANESSIREVFPFPKNGKAQDPMMGAPGTISEEQLKDVHIQIRKEQKRIK